MKYLNTRNKEQNIVATVIATDEKAKTVTLEYENGKTTVVTTSTLKRWWKPIKEESTMEENKTKKEEVTNAIKQAVKEKAESKKKDEQAKPKAEPKAEEKKAAPKAKAEAKPTKKKEKEKAGISIDQAHKLIKEQIKKAGYEAVITEKNPKLVYVVVNGKKPIGVYTGGTKCALKMPGEFVPKGCKPDKVRNCPRSHVFDIPYDSMDKLSDILSKMNTTNKEDK